MKQMKTLTLKGQTFEVVDAESRRLLSELEPVRKDTIKVTSITDPLDYYIVCYDCHFTSRGLPAGNYITDHVEYIEGTDHIRVHFLQGPVLQWEDTESITNYSDDELRVINEIFSVKDKPISLISTYVAEYPTIDTARYYIGSSTNNTNRASLIVDDRGNVVAEPLNEHLGVEVDSSGTLLCSNILGVNNFVKGRSNKLVFDESHGGATIFGDKNTVGWDIDNIGYLPDRDWDSSLSFTTGCANTTVGLAAFTAGANNTNTGNYSTVFGANNSVEGELSYSEGTNNKTIGNYNHTEGTSNENDGERSHIEGHDNVIAPQVIAGHAEGIMTTVKGNYSHAEGMNTVAQGTQCHAEGLSVLAKGTASHAEGEYTTTYGIRSHAEGKNTVTGSASGNWDDGDAAHAEGNGTTALGKYSHAEGFETEAHGINSHAEGRWTKATANHSHAGGIHTQATASAQTVVGVASAVNNNALFIVGNGEFSGNTVTKQSNAFEVLTSGDIKAAGAVYAQNKKLATEEFVNNTLQSSIIDSVKIKDRATAQVYSLYIENGELKMEVAE